jgi:hypothetical protein
LFGKPVLKWSDDDVREALRVYRDCVMKLTTPTSVPHPAQNWERQIPLIIATARNLDARRKAQQQAKIEMERRKAEEAAQKAAQAEKDRKAAEEARKAAENQQAIAQAIKKRQDDEEKAAREKHEAELRAAERKQEVESMPLTATDVQGAVDKVAKFVADYSARKIDGSNVEARLKEGMRAADEASQLIKTVKDHMTEDDDPRTLDLENKIVAFRPHLDELRAKIDRIPQEIADEKAEKEKADRLVQQLAEEEADRQRDAKEVGERHLAVNTMFENVLVVLNDGEVTVRLTDIQINVPQGVRRVTYTESCSMVQCWQQIGRCRESAAHQT